MAEDGLLQLDQNGPVTRVRLDTGRTNALGLDAVRALASALAEAEARAETQVLLLAGRPGIFCSGLDTAVIRAGGGEAGTLAAEMDAVLRALLRSRLRVVSCVTGHAVGAGAMLLLCSDVRVGARGEFRIGFPDVGVGIPLPDFPIRLARARLNRRWFESATLLGRLFTPAEAVDVGFLDWVEGAGKALKVATQTAEGLAKLPEAAYVDTLLRVRAELLPD